MYSQVFACEEDMVPEGTNNAAPSIPLVGVQRMHADKELWTSYFYGDMSVESKLTKILQHDESK